MPLVIERSWVGRRISVRRVVGRSPQGREQFADVVGELVGLTDLSAVVAGRAGTTEVRRDQIAMARLVPASTAEELALQRVLAAGWPAEQQETLGRWRLQAAGGFTRRANSVLVAGQPDRPLDDALDYAAQWYAARGLPLILQVPTEARRLLDAELGERGWAPSGETQALVRPVGAEPAQDLVRLADDVSPQWLAVYREGRTVDNPHARAVLTGTDPTVFAQVLDEHGQAIAVGRGVVTDGWLAISCLDVVPDRRRQGLATHIVRGLLHWGAASGAARAAVAVEDDNQPSLALFAALGFWSHHSYRYRHAPA